MRFSAGAVHLIIAIRAGCPEGQGEVKFIHPAGETVCSLSLTFRHMQFRRH